MKYNQSSFNYLKSYQKVVPKCEEWENLEYSLRLSYGSPFITLKSAWAVSNPNLAVRFSRKPQGEILDSWIETKYLEENNELEKVLERGFHFPDSGLVFPNGNISLTNDYQKEEIIELMLVRINVKNPFGVTFNRKNDIIVKSNLPADFECVFLMNNNDNTSNTDGSYKNNYILYDDDDALPIFVVHAYLEKFKQKESQEVLSCFSCQKKLATIYCKTEEADLCDSCSMNHHNKMGKMSEKHIMVPITNKKNIFENCSQHPNSNYEFFCPKDNEPLCVYCKIHGSHSQGNKLHHKIIDIDDAYKQIQNEIEQPDQFLDKKKDRLIEQLCSVDLRIADINKNSKYVEDQIYDTLKSLLSKLQEATYFKLKSILCEKIEIQRRINEISWLQSFIRYQRDLIAPSSFLKAWPRHLHFRDMLLNNPDVALRKVDPDIQLAGKLSIKFNDLNKKFQLETTAPLKNSKFSKCFSKCSSPTKNNLIEESKQNDEFIKSIIDDSLKKIEQRIFFSLEERKEKKKNNDFSNDSMDIKTDRIRQKEYFLVSRMSKLEDE